MKILVTGGAGFIGSHIVDALVDQEKHEVVVLDNLDPQVHPKPPDYMNKKAKYYFGMVGDVDLLKRALEGVEVLFHEAAAVGVGQSMYEIEKYIGANTYETSKMLDFIVNEENSVEKIIVASSMSIYGEGTYKCSNCGIVYPSVRTGEQMKRRMWEMRCPICDETVLPLPTKEDKPLRPTSIYAISKRDQEEMCHVVGNAYGIPTVALRYFNVYGPRQSLNNPYTGVCAIFSSRIKNSNAPVIFEDGIQSRDFIFVKDVVKANLLALRSNSSNYRSFNVGTGKPVTIHQIADALIDLYGADLKPDIVNKYRSGDIRHCFADISEIEKLGFEPTVAFNDGLRELVGWGEGEAATDRFEEAHEELKLRGLVEE